MGGLVILPGAVTANAVTAPARGRLPSGRKTLTTRRRVVAAVVATAAVGSGAVLPAENGYAVRVSAAGARSLAADPAVAYVEKDQKVGLDATQVNPPRGLDRIDQPRLPIVAVRVLGGDGSGTTSGVIAGVDWVSSHRVRPAVANLSLGGGTSTALDAAVSSSIASGVTYAVAAGNANADAANTSPARVGAAITVGAGTSADYRAGYSNYGSVLDLFAPGSSIPAGRHTGDTATVTLSGTSMATPHVVGAAAGYLASHPTASPATVRGALVGGATIGVLRNIGTGSPNRLLRVVP
ncbi:S8 family serine peptidase [Streptomyces sp. NPDC014995]|uniref:S8 family serine peptidase n=1 Tax=Streptomyces sp. NPDC014995 TaxID=3364936 RepID=UPI0036FB1CDA